MSRTPRNRAVPLSGWDQEMLRALRTNDGEQRRRPRRGLAPDVLWEAAEVAVFFGARERHLSVMAHLRERAALP